MVLVFDVVQGYLFCFVIYLFNYLFIHYSIHDFIDGIC